MASTGLCGQPMGQLELLAWVGFRCTCWLGFGCAVILRRLAWACPHGEGEEDREQDSVKQKRMTFFLKSRIRTATVKFCCILEDKTSLELVHFK